VENAITVERISAMDVNFPKAEDICIAYTTELVEVFH
jgi:hypothetical protein